jgi:hypothetical protein
VARLKPGWSRALIQHEFNLQPTRPNQSSRFRKQHQKHCSRLRCLHHRLKGFSYCWRGDEPSSRSEVMNNCAPLPKRVRATVRTGGTQALQASITALLTNAVTFSASSEE